MTTEINGDQIQCERQNVNNVNDNHNVAVAGVTFPMSQHCPLIVFNSYLMK